MNKSMFSGVAGLKTHQSKMDVIGNNIANVNTYGFKSNRAVFSDVFYQTIQGATGGTASSGGTNPSSIGYGSMLASVQTQMTTSSLQSTGYGMDVAIAGEGFLQVMDADGNIFYTKAGMLTYDSNGYLVDINGNFVLGAGSSTADPDTQKIKLDDIGSVDASTPSTEMTINGVTYTIKGSNATSYGNASITMSSSEALPSGLKASASISATGAITVTLNAFEKFSSMDELNEAVNTAILEANGGIEHAGGKFTITASENVFGTDAVAAGVSGSVIQNSASINISDVTFFNGKLTVTDFTADPTVELSSAVNNTGSISLTDMGTGYQMIAIINGVEYKNTQYINALDTGEITLTSADGGSITMKIDGYLESIDLDTSKTSAIAVSAPNYFLGGATITALSDGFETSGYPTFAITDEDPDLGVTVTVSGKTYTGTVTSAGGANIILTNDDGSSITMNFPSFETMKANLGLSSSASVDDLTTAMNSTANANSLYVKAASPAVAQSLTGAQIVGTAGGIDKGSVAGTAADTGFFGGIMTVKDVSSGFEGSGQVANSAFVATYYGAGEYTKSTGEVCENETWVITMDINGITYTGVLEDGEQAGSLLLQSPGGDYIEVSNPGFSAMSTAYGTSSALVSGATMEAFDATDGVLTITPSTASVNLGLGTNSMVLTGGTEGGAITLDQISNISIGSDGTIAVSHSEKGTVVAGKISLAVFANSAGLQLMGTNYYATTVNSGEPVLVDPGTSGSGGLVASALEMSNVDISNEFAEMITCQRGFQANSRIITVSDTMLEELINLKR